MPLDLNALLIGEGIDPAAVGIMRHRPYEAQLAKVFRWLPGERIDLFEAYQQSQDARIESALLGITYLASFVGLEPRTATFVGLYRNCGHEAMTRDQYWSDPAHVELKRLGMVGWKDDEVREAILRFDFQPVDFYPHWKGRLKVGWPPPERSWWRRAHNNIMPVVAIADDSAFSPAMPDWHERILTWAELHVLPSRMQSALARWRGIYLIRDSTDGLGYVGSAGGSENLLGRWRNDAASGHGGNRLLKGRDPVNFIYSILQRTSPDLPQDELVQLESSWKRRLPTRFPAGLNDN